MILKVFEDTPSLARAAADQAATAIRSAITNHGSVKSEMAVFADPGEGYIVWDCSQVAVVNDQLLVCGFLTGVSNSRQTVVDPPADFETDQPYIIVQLDAACRQQQVGEGEELLPNWKELF